MNPPVKKGGIETGQGQFLRFLVHELRNLAAPIRNIVHVMRLGGGVDKRTQSLVDIIDRQVVAIDQMLNRIGEAVRASQGEIAVEFAEVVLSDVMDTAVQAVKPALEKRRQQLHMALPSVPVRLRADPVHLAQVFSTLLDNASKFSPEQGDIYVTANAPAGRVEVGVRDNGTGITNDLLPVVFDFFPLRNQTGNREGAGLGLSLAIARILVESHRGSITASSEGLGKGSEFSVALPLIVTQGDHPHANSERNSGDVIDETAAVPKEAGRRILIADDSEAVRTSLSSLLGELGHDVKCATDGEQALAVARGWRPEFVLLDINMPKIGGVEVARQLRPEFSSAIMKLVMMTGADLDQAMLAGAKRVGFDFMIDKIDALEPLRNILAQDTSAEGISGTRNG